MIENQLTQSLMSRIIKIKEISENYPFFLIKCIKDALNDVCFNDTVPGEIDLQSFMFKSIFEK